MTFSNLEYLYQHLPARFRHDDANLFLKRFLQWFGEQLDGWDEDLDTFYQRIDPETAPNEFVIWWLWALFGWSWYPSWFTLDRKRQLFADFATHLARRGTRRGIEEFLRAFSIHARMYNRPLVLEEAICGEEAWAIDDALGVVVQISHLADEVNHDVQGQAVEELYLEEGYITDTLATLTRREIEELIRFEWPNGQRLMIEYQTRPNLTAWDSAQPIFNETIVPDENSGPFVGA